MIFVFQELQLQHWLHAVQISGTSSSFDQSASNATRPLLGSELEAALGGCTVAPYMPLLPSLQTTGKSLGPWQRAEWF